MCNINKRFHCHFLIVFIEAYSSLPLSTYRDASWRLQLPYTHWP